MPNGAIRIFEQFEVEAGHRRSLEREDAITSRLDLLGGQALVAVFLIGAYAVTVFAVLRGADWVAGIVGSLTTALTIVFSAWSRAKTSKLRGGDHSDERERGTGVGRR